MISISNKQAGFSILEAIVAIFLLSLSIAGIFTAVQASLNQTNQSKDEVRAFFLASEAFEIIRNKRDANQLYNLANSDNLRSWLTGITNSASSCPFSSPASRHVCRIDSTTRAFTDCGASWDSCPVLKQDNNVSAPAYLWYNYSTGIDTKFKREVMIEKVNSGNDDEIAVTVRVTWTRGIFTRSFTVKDHFFNLYKYE